MVPEDRQVSGLVQSLSVLANMTISSLGRFARGPWLSPASETVAATGMAAGLRIKSHGLEHNIESLSGGNQQKVVIAKCLLTEPRVLLLDEPTRGVDVGAKREIHAIVKRLAASGMGIILVSSELEEVRAVATRIVVMSRGAITAEFDAAQATDDALASAASASPEQRDVGVPRSPGGLPHQTGGTT
jgi:erythritol transport system ATP-binding protein